MDLGERFKIHSNSLEPKRGNILISEPLMNDLHFGRSVILLVDHEESEGSFGVIINKTLNVGVSQIVDEFPDFEAPAYLGGPVCDNQLFFVHPWRDDSRIQSHHRRAFLGWRLRHAQDTDFHGYSQRKQHTFLSRLFWLGCRPTRFGIGQEHMACRQHHDAATVQHSRRDDVAKLCASSR